jgi:hypothetical protein
MALLIGAGQRYDRVIGVGGVTTSTDGYLWSSSSQITQPFPPNMRAQGVAGNSTGTAFVAISNTGWSATSTDLLTWQANRLLAGNFSPLGISWGENGSGARPLFVLAGSRIYNDDNTLPGEYELGDQIAQILINETGGPYGWDQAFTHPFANSWFHNVRYFENIMVDSVPCTVWVAVGQVNGQPDIWFTQNVNWDVNTGAPDTNTWQRVAIPSGLVNRPLYDVTDYQGTLYFSGRGVVINTSDLGTPVWQSSPFFSAVSDLINTTSSMLLGSVYDSNTNTVLGTNFYYSAELPVSQGNHSLSDFLSIASNPDGQLAAASSGGLIYSNDRIGWTATVISGYWFQSVIWFQDHWVAGAYSDLTQYTYWTSTDGVTWLPWNNGVQIYGLWGSDTVTVTSTGSNLLLSQSSTVVKSSQLDNSDLAA